MKKWNAPMVEELNVAMTESGLVGKEEKSIIEIYRKGNSEPKS